MCLSIGNTVTFRGCMQFTVNADNVVGKNVSRVRHHVTPNLFACPEKIACTASIADVHTK